MRLAALAGTVGLLLFVPAAAQAGVGFGSFSFTSPEEFAGPVGLAVDNSAGASEGDVYVVDQGHNALKKFSVSGTTATQEWSVELPEVGGNIAQPNQAVVDENVGADHGDVYVAGYNDGAIYRVNEAGTEVTEPIEGLANPTGVAVDSAGNFFVCSNSEGTVLEYNANWEPIDAAGIPVEPGENIVMEGVGGAQTVAVDPTGENIYVATGGGTLEATLIGGSYIASGTFDEAGYNGVTVAPSGEIYVDQGNEVAIYEPSGTLVGTVGSGRLSGAAYGVGVSTAGTVYVADNGYNDVEVFEEGPTPETPETLAASTVAGTSAVLNGKLKLGMGETAVKYFFEYAKGASCSGGTPTKTPEKEGSGVVSEALSGLVLGTEYTFCLHAVNGFGETVGASQTFTTFAIASEAVPAVTAGEAEVSALLGTSEETTTYRVQYGTSSVEESMTPEMSVPGASAPVAVELRLGGLQAATTYHFRFLVNNRHSHASGEELAFTTSATPVKIAEACPNEQRRAEQPYGQDLPDCRAYEMVSPVDTEGQDATDSFGGTFPRAALSGEAIIYTSKGTFAGPAGDALENQFVSRRGPEGWSTQSVTPPHEQSDSEAEGSSFRANDLTPELTEGVASTTAKLTPEAPFEGNQHNEGLYVGDFADGVYRYVNGSYRYTDEALNPLGSSTEELTHVVFGEFGTVSEWVNGITMPVSVTNEGENMDASVGGIQPNPSYTANRSVWRAVSADGSRVYFSSPAVEEENGKPEPPGQLYVRVHSEQSQSPIASPEANGTGTLTEGSNVITSVVVAAGTEGLTAEKGQFALYVTPTRGKFVVGESVSGPPGTIEPGTTITNVSELSEAGFSGVVLTLSKATAARIGEGSLISSGGPTPFAVGQKISGDGIPGGTTIEKAEAGELTLSKPAASYGSGVELRGGGGCTEPPGEEACTIDVSASQRLAANPAGIRTARYWGASTDGSRVFFTSDAELTEDAHTGTTTEQEVSVEHPFGEGTFTLTFEGQTTSALEYDATPEKVQEALEMLSSIGDGNVTVVTGKGSAESTFLVTFGSFAGPEPPLMTAEGDESVSLTATVSLHFAANLYEYDLETGKLTDLTGEMTDVSGEGAAVQGVVQISEDGSYVYFVAKGALTGPQGEALRNENERGEDPRRGEPNLYVSHEDGAPMFIATLSSKDEGDWHAGRYPGEGGPEQNTAVVSPSGGRLAFLSEKSLTGYDNEQAETGECEGKIGGVGRSEHEETGECQEVYLYDTETGGAGSLACASCNPTGARPVGPSSFSVEAFGAEDLYRSRNLLEDGALFFDSSDALVPHAGDSRRNVYEYEHGHVYAISDVAGGSESFFMDASANGDNVFFATADRLLPQDTSNNVVVYDARVYGGFPVTVAPLACTTAEACRTASAPAPAVYGAPASATFSGPGNLVPPPPAVVKPKPKSLTRAQKLADALKSCRKDRKKARRRACEKRARGQYGSGKKKAKKSTERKGSK